MKEINDKIVKQAEAFTQQNVEKGGVVTDVRQLQGSTFIQMDIYVKLISK